MTNSNKERPIDPISGARTSITKSLTIVAKEARHPRPSSSNPTHVVQMNNSTEMSLDRGDMEAIALAALPVLANSIILARTVSSVALAVFTSDDIDEPASGGCSSGLVPAEKFGGVGGVFATELFLPIHSTIAALIAGRWRRRS